MELFPEIMKKYDNFIELFKEKKRGGIVTDKSNVEKKIEIENLKKKYKEAKKIFVDSIEILNNEQNKQLFTQLLENDKYRDPTRLFIDNLRGFTKNENLRLLLSDLTYKKELTDNVEKLNSNILNTANKKDIDDLIKIYNDNMQKINNNFVPLTYENFVQDMKKIKNYIEEVEEVEEVQKEQQQITTIKQEKEETPAEVAQQITIIKPEDRIIKAKPLYSKNIIDTIASIISIGITLGIPSSVLLVIIVYLSLMTNKLNN